MKAVTSREGTMRAQGPAVLVTPSPPAPYATAHARRQVALWLLVCCVLVAGMVALGGVTRLTGSGLSIVEWELVRGILPPFGEAAWEVEFARYRESPEYRHVNYGMSLAEFQRIYWFEWAHRLFGRAVGLAFLVPFLWFAVRRRIAPDLLPTLALMFLLGGMQGVLGWWMVQSGLVDVPRVSPYRLTAHLGIAVALYAWMLWVALDLLRGPPAPATFRHPPWRLATIATGLVVVTILSGGFVAGLRAGMVYNTFPKMGGAWWPAGMMDLEPWYVNLFENVTTVQFDHRVLAMATLATVVVVWIRCLRAGLPAATRIWAHGALVLMLVQFGLGVTTLLLRVPVALGVAHQVNALALTTVLLVLLHRLMAPNARPGHA